MSRPPSVRLRPSNPVRCGDYDLDALTLVLEQGKLDFRLELGRGIEIFWALPAARGDRLRLVLVDAAAYHVDEPALVADPFVFDCPRTEWRGELGQLGDGIELVRVAFEARTAPAAYACEVELRAADTTSRIERLAWRAAPSRA